MNDVPARGTAPGVPCTMTNTPPAAIWSIELEVESGGQARVYKVRDPSSGRTCALKVPRTSDRAAVARLGREGAQLASVRHPNLVAVVGMVELGDRPALLLEWVEGSSLADVLGSVWWSPDRVDEIALPLLSAVSALHGAGLVHRDIKAHNVVVAGSPSEGLRPVLIDLGFARGEDCPRHTCTDDMVGSEDWAAPEQLRGAEPDPTADVWSLGVLLYRMATGAEPFPDEGDLLDRYRARAAGRFVDPRVARADLCERRAAILRAALDPDPARRPRDAGDLLARWVAGSVADPPQRQPGALFTGEQYTSRRGRVHCIPMTLRTAGSWQLETLIGEGACGGVWRARHARLGTLAAAKVFRASDADRALNEAEALRRVRSEHVVRLLDCVWDPAPVIVTELVEGVSLEAWVDKRGVLPVPLWQRLGLGLLSGLRDLHAAGVLHGDLTPANVLIGTSGHGFDVRIADLGLARYAGGRSVDGSIGTLGFAAPEQVLDPSGIDVRADLFGAAAVLYFAATGGAVFDGSCRWDRVLATVEGLHCPLGQQRPDLPPALVAAVDVALSAEPRHRFIDAETLLRAWRSPGSRGDRSWPDVASLAPP
ncbi:MAG: serine/threonine protein kinase [Alphaproteobacteria bacterium]|nr:serine/threonine protein kinase [Alphaproteobacteria bacterium]